jgi:hypothetical protein
MRMTAGFTRGRRLTIEQTNVRAKSGQPGASIVVKQRATRRLTNTEAALSVKIRQQWLARGGYPSNHGFQYKNLKTLQKGERIDRRGWETGDFSSPEGETRGRALPPAAANVPLTVYEVVKPFPVLHGPAKEHKDLRGGADQYMHPLSLAELEAQGYIRKIPASSKPAPIPSNQNPTRTNDNTKKGLKKS